MTEDYKEILVKEAAALAGSAMNMQRWLLTTRSLSCLPCAGALYPKFRAGSAELPYSKRRNNEDEHSPGRDNTIYFPI